MVLCVRWVARKRADCHFISSTTYIDCWRHFWQRTTDFKPSEKIRTAGSQEPGGRVGQVSHGHALRATAPTAIEGDDGGVVRQGSIHSRGQSTLSLELVRSRLPTLVCALNGPRSLRIAAGTGEYDVTIHRLSIELRRNSGPVS